MSMKTFLQRVVLNNAVVLNNGDVSVNLKNNPIGLFEFLLGKLLS